MGLAKRRKPILICQGLAKGQIKPSKGVSPMVIEEASYWFAGLAAAL